MSFVYAKFQPERMDQRPAYGFSHRIRASVEKHQITPSPLDYHAEKVTLGPSVKAFSFGHRPRTNYVRDCSTPGPGEYFIGEEIQNRKKTGYSFGLKPKMTRPKSHTPGPKYLAESIGSFQPQPGFSFGYRPRFYRRISDTPGPGEYDSEKLSFKSPAFSFGVKNKRAKIQVSPSAASYRPEITFKNSPGFSFGIKSRTRVFAPVDFDTPGPGEYDTNQPSFNSSCRGFSFGLRVSNCYSKSNCQTTL